MKLKAINEDSNYIDPDSIYTDSVSKWSKSTDPNQSTGMISFIYIPNKMLYASDDAEPHVGILMNNAKLFGGPSTNHHEFDFDDELYDWAESYRRDTLEQIALVGRVGLYKDRHIVSFWNQKRQPYQQLLKSCIEKLLQDGQITNDSYVSIPKVGTFSISKVDKFLSRFDTNTSGADDQKIAKQRELHLARGETKKKLRKDLGLAQHSGKSPWQSAMEKAKKIAPGHKWWAATSESKD